MTPSPPSPSAALSPLLASALRSPLFPHQLAGLHWMERREDDARREGLSPSGGIVADEAGLGKSLMCLALLLSHKGAARCPCHSEEADAPSLVICPRGVRQQWLNEVAQHCHATALSTLLLDSVTEKTVRESDLRCVDVVVASYETVRSQHRRWRSRRASEKSTAPLPPPPPPPLFSLSFHRVICDEAHRIRSRTAQVTQAVMEVKARHRFFVTATPLHNSIDDLYTAMAFLRYRPYSEYREWKRWMHTKDGRGIQRLQTLLQAVMLRRRKGTRPLSHRSSRQWHGDDLVRPLSGRLLLSLPVSLLLLLLLLPLLGGVDVSEERQHLHSDVQSAVSALLTSSATPPPLHCSMAWLRCSASRVT